MRTLRSHRWLAALAALLLLMGTAMPALVRMNCRSGGHSVVSIGQAKDCCPEQQERPDGAQFRAVCCEFQRTAPNLSDLHVGSGPILTAVAFPTAVGTFEPMAVCGEPAPGYARTSRPPPLLTSERLSQVGSFLI